MVKVKAIVKNARLETIGSILEDDVNSKFYSSLDLLELLSIRINDKSRDEMGNGGTNGETAGIPEFIRLFGHPGGTNDSIIDTNFENDGQ